MPGRRLAVAIAAMAADDDRRKRNGREVDLRLLPVPEPVERRTRPEPVRAPDFPPGWVREPNFKRYVADPLVAMSAHMNYQTEQAAENFAQLVALTNGVNRVVKYLSGPGIEERARQASSADLTEAADKLDDAVERLEEIADKTDPGEGRVLTPRTVEKMTDEKIAMAAMERRALDAEKRASVAEERLREQRSDVKEKKRDWRTMYFGAGAAAIGLIVATFFIWAAVAAYGRAQREAGRAEGPQPPTTVTPPPK